ncbi:hypothetical protein DFP73DRAFT_517685 [Morchella snyderi]|nr:hypothetical protein DFP73DRAFT_517685 [Morchella snyderi]
MSSTTLNLSLKQLPRSVFTAESLPGLIRDGLDFVRTIPNSREHTSETTVDVNWALAKSDADIKVYSTTHNKERWTSRVTVAPGVPYEVVRRSLAEEKNKAELEYLCKPEDTMEVTAIEYFEELKIRLEDVHKLLHVQAFSAREFLETVISHDLPESKNGLRSFIVVSMPLEGNARSKSVVLGQYVSVDYVHELEEGGVEILLALCSDAKGSIPRWMQNMAMTTQVFGDGRLFLDYLVKKSQDGKQ